MSRGKKIIVGIIGVLAVLVLVIAGILIYNIRKPFPKTTGTITVSGLTADVNLIRDEWGVPHIYASNTPDLFFGQGYVHAQDRFWQMEFWRHVGEGRISEISGSATIDSDRFIRTMGWHRMAQNTVDYYKANDPDYYALLEAYAAGVNAYIEANRDNISLNQTILGLVNEPWEIEPWTPLNTVSWGVVMADDLSGNWGSEIRRAQLIEALGEATVTQLLPFYPYDTRPVMVPTSAMEQSNLIQNTQYALRPDIDWSNVNLNTIPDLPDNITMGRGAFVGSNNWVVSGEYTDTGMPLLANDPHLGIQLPSIWYEVGLHSPDFQVVGFSFAGVPGVIIGHNENIAWGVTNVGPDVQDLFIEKINPDNPNQYEFMGEWRDMEVIEEVIKVNGGEDVPLTVKITHHGPIINDISSAAREGEDVLAMQWTAKEPSRVLQSVILLNQAQNYDGFREALRFWDVPAQNFVYADTAGNIAYQTPGLIPIRKNGNGLTPVPGWTGEYEWEGWIPYDELPHLLNPDQGFIVTANHAVVDQDYPYLISLDWANGDRGQRITDMISETIAQNGQITAEDFGRIQFDSKSLLAESFAPAFIGLSSSNPDVQGAIERLRGWEGYQERRDSVPAAIFEIFYMNLVRRTLADDVGEENVSRTHSTIFFHALASQTQSGWWDDITTTPTETRNDIILLALADTVNWFKENVGDDSDDWTWGNIHTATFVSNPLGASGVAPIENIVNRGPFPADGGGNLVNAMAWSWNDPARINWHPSMRMIIDMQDFDASQTIHPTGQSGHPYHKHYDDMIQLYLNGEFHPMWFSENAVREAGTDTLLLQPE
jgi:penicillin amidase